jgi:hypothetical protein
VFEKEKDCRMTDFQSTGQILSDVLKKGLLMFKPATKEVAYVKGSIYGPPGSGKTTLTAMLLIHLSKTYHNCAPVAWLASEKGVDFVMEFFKLEGVPLLVERSRSFIDLKKAHSEALKAGCCGLGIDSTSHFWADLLQAAMKQSGPRLSRIQRAKEEWAPFAADFQDKPIHSLATGRLGYKWLDAEVENDRGEITQETFKGGTKMKAEGDFGHEPDLEIEMSAVEDPDFVKYEKVRGKTRRTFRSQMIHAATVKKSRVWALNGKAFTWTDQPKYKAGYYKQVAGVFQPHFDTMTIGGNHHPGGDGGSDTSIIFTPNSEYSVREQETKKQIAIEKWDTTMQLIAGGQTKDNIRVRQIVGGLISGTRSKTEFERLPLDIIEHHLAVLLAFETRMKQDTPPDEDSLVKLIGLARRDVEEPGHDAANKTLLEVWGEQTLNGLKHKPGSSAEFAAKARCEQIGAGR